MSKKFPARPRALSCVLLAYLLLFAQVAPLRAAAGWLPAPRRARETASPAPGGHVSSIASAPLPLAAPAITATKVDSWDDSVIPNGKAEPGQTVTYTVTISNTGTMDATGVTFTDSVDPNTTLVPGSVQTQPIADPDTYNVIGNVRIQPNAAQGVLANDRDPDTGNNSGLTVASFGPSTGAETAAGGSGTSAQGGNVTVNSDGSFSYNPSPGFTGTDTFKYTATDGTKTDTVTATLTVGNGTATPGSNVVWFVNPAAASGGDGRLTSPFNCYTGASASCFSQTAADDPGDAIFLFNGAVTGGYALLASQKLVGQGASDTLANIAGLTVPTASDALPATNAMPSGVTMTTLNVDAVPLPAGAANTPLARGFTIGNTGTGTKISGTTFGTLTLGNNTTPDVILSGTGRALSLSTGTFAAASGLVSVASSTSASQGISLSGITGSGTISFGSTSISNSLSQCIVVGTTTYNINFGNTTASSCTDGVSLTNNSGGTRTFGTLGVSTASAKGLVLSSGAGNTTVTGAATISSNGNAIDVQNQGSTTVAFQAVVSATSTGSGITGVNLQNNSGAAITFSALTVQTNAGTGLNATGGGTVTVTNNTGTINNTTQAAAAVVANGVTLNAGFATVNSSGGTNGISLTSVAGSQSFGTGALSGASGAPFLVSGGTASVSYNGTVTQNTAGQRAVDIQNKTGGTITLGGLVTSNGGSGVFVNNNAGATNSFTGGLSLSTGAAAAFTATGGGTVTVTDPAGATSNKLQTTTGTALNVANTTIGASGLTFERIDVDGNDSLPASGIILNATGALGGLTVTGTGGAGTGGTIQDASGDGVSLTSTEKVSLSSMNITSNLGDGIGGSNVNGLQLNGLSVSTNGDSAAADDSGINLTQLTGTTSGGSRPTSITNSTFTNNFEFQIQITNSSGTLADLQMSGDTVSGNGASGSGGNLFNFLATGTAAMTLNLTGGSFTGNSPDTANGVNCDAGGTTAFMTCNVSGGTYTNNFVAISVSTSTGGGMAFNVSNNLATGNESHGLNLFLNASSTGTVNGKFVGNTVGTLGSAGSGSAFGFGIRVQNESSSAASPAANVLISGNTVQETANFASVNVNQGISQPASRATNVTIVNNTLRNSGARAVAVQQNNNTDTTGSAGTTCADISGNEMNGIVGQAGDGSKIRVRQLTGGTFFLKQTNASGLAAANSPPNGVATTTTTAAQVSIGGAMTATAGCTQPNNAPVTFEAEETGTNGAPMPSTPLQAAEVATPRPDGEPRGAAVNAAPADVAAPASRPAPPSGGRLLLKGSKSQDLGTRVLRYSVADMALRAETLTATAQRRKVKAPVLTDDPGTPKGAGGTVSVNIGTLAPGDSVTITFQVTIDNPYSGGPNISNQGTVSGSNFSNVLTDDPDIAGANNPTLTPVNSTDIRVNDASQSEPATGTSQMLFTLTLSQPAGAGGLSVNYATANGGATPATGGASCDGTNDYITASGTATVPAGSQTTTIPVTVCADSVGGESSETLLLNISSPSSGAIVDNQATGTITQGNNPGTFIISELRTSGPAGATDEFVEFYNNTNSPLTVAASDASAGYGLYKMGATCGDTPVLIGTIPNGTVIPARGHYLMVGSAYSLANYGGTGAAAGNLTMTADIENDRNLGVFSTATVANISSANRLDAVGGDSNTGAVCDLLREGTNLPAVSGSTTEHSFFRFEGQAAGGNPKDTNDNASDFKFADTQGTFISGVTQQLGAPGPEKWDPLESTCRHASLSIL